MERIDIQPINFGIFQVLGRLLAIEIELFLECVEPMTKRQ